MRYLLLFLITCASRPESGSEIRRIVSLAPSLTEIVFFLDGGDRLVGVTTFCDYPEQAKSIYKVGDFSNPSLERIIALKPDLILATMPEQRRIIIELMKMDIPVFTSHPRTLVDIISEIDSIAHLLKVRSPRDSLLDLIQSSPVKERPRVYLELSPDPIITIGSSSYLNDLIKKSGGENIFSDLNLEFPSVNWADVLRRDPEIILIFHTQDYRGRIGWKGLSAVRSGMVIDDLNPDIYLRPGPRTFQAYSELKEIISRCGE